MEATRQLEAQLNDFSPAKRTQALEALIASGEPAGARQEAVNLHCHTFFSFNAYGYSPTGLAWLARQRGFKALGIVDFDVLDGVDEFLDACELLGVRGSAGMETRGLYPRICKPRDQLPRRAGSVLLHGHRLSFEPASGRSRSDPGRHAPACRRTQPQRCWPALMHSFRR